MRMERLHRQTLERQQQADTSGEIADSQPEAESTTLNEGLAAFPVQPSQHEDSSYAPDSNEALLQVIWSEKIREEQSTAETQHAGRKRHITDRQAGAERISPIDESGGSATSAQAADAAATTQRSRNVKSPRKRTADEANVNDNDDNNDNRRSMTPELIRPDDEADIEVQATPAQAARKRRRVGETGRQSEGGRRGAAAAAASAATMTNPVPLVEIDNRGFTSAQERPTADGNRAESSRAHTEQTVVTVEASDVRQGKPKTSRRRFPASLQEQPAREGDVEHQPTASAPDPGQSRHRRRGQEEQDEDYEPSLIRDDGSSEPSSSPAQERSEQGQQQMVRVDEATGEAAMIELPRQQNKPRQRAPGADAPPQVRKRWSIAEEKRLIWLVGKLGGDKHVSWSWIAQKDLEEPGEPKVSDRDPRPSYLQMKLKDKAHQIIVDHYRYGYLLSFCLPLISSS